MIKDALRPIYRYVFPRRRSGERCDWIAERFAAARVAYDPCPHLIVENVLPPELYKTIEEDIPSQRDWKLGGAMKAIERRKGLRPLAGDLAAGAFPQVSLDLANAKRSPIFLRHHARRWSRQYLAYVQLISALVKQAMAPAALEYMRYLIDSGLYDGPQEQRSVFQEFCLRTQGWAIRPHAHDLQQAIQWMLYFPLPGSTEDQGTAFYRLTKPKTIPASTLSKTIWFEPDEVEYCFMAPYRPNLLVAFLNTPLTVHGTVAIPDMVARRYLFVGSLWKAKNAEIDVELSPERFPFAGETRANPEIAERAPA